MRLGKEKEIDNKTLMCRVDIHTATNPDIDTTSITEADVVNFVPIAAELVLQFPSTLPKFGSSIVGLEVVLSLSST